MQTLDEMDAMLTSERGAKPRVMVILLRRYSFASTI